ncbi:hypothetical protein SAMN05216249_11319 [Acetitomaculum ruminis DSM 5522]|uniref:Cyclic nucleotide-binding domain-containing protein n=1 Tax=Acetitomaculum ruminis DSM 5522 TaxID=1120918 RepID=A0A1I0Z5F1_9FIRM|nr:hypothetical protein [Acetitomaculum ruminis]SFB20577.1 hypothetical protein SAMN05216249_11319 [Acetitomaculum ruminis DSM 5522]
MKSVVYKKRQQIYTPSDAITQISIVKQGRVQIDYGYFKMVVSAGYVLEGCELFHKEYMASYTAVEETELLLVDFVEMNSLYKFLTVKPNFTKTIVNSSLNIFIQNLNKYNILKTGCDDLFKYITKEYKEYKYLCNRLSITSKNIRAIDTLRHYSPTDSFPAYLREHYNSLAKLPAETRYAMLNPNPATCTATIHYFGMDFSKLYAINKEMKEYNQKCLNILINETGDDFFNTICDLSIKLHESNGNFKPIDEKYEALKKLLLESYLVDDDLLKERISAYEKNISEIRAGNILDNVEENFIPDENILEDDDEIMNYLAGSLDQILEYSELDSEVTDAFKKNFQEFSAFPNKNSTDDDVRIVRKRIGDKFNDIYKACIIKSLTTLNTPVLLKMFFLFGYMDENIAGRENAITLFKCAQNSIFDNNSNVLTFYQWLEKIYDGEVEPSKNTFDTEYVADLRTKKRSGDITEAEYNELLVDPKAKCIFEIDNMFKTCNQTTFGRITTFFPIFAEYNLMKPFDAAYLEESTINSVLEDITDVDYMAYYREILYTGDESIKSLYYEKEIKPYIILMPNIGGRGVMWQEISGSYRDTPARMMLSILFVEKLEDVMLKLTGEFRWEMCRRNEGARWNDVSCQSLTAEFFDYIQFYKKNHELSSEAKEKTKTLIQRSRNSLKEIFTSQYAIWIKNECKNASPRLNKVERRIMFSYCYPSRKYRTVMGKSPIFSQYLERLNILQAKKAHSINLLFAKITKEGGTISPELEEYRALYVNPANAK